METLRPVDLIMRLHFAVTESGAVATKAEALRALVRCGECTLKEKCPIRKNFAFFDEDDFYCAFGAEEGAPWEDNGGDNNEDTKL